VHNDEGIYFGKIWHSLGPEGYVFVGGDTEIEKGLEAKDLMAIAEFLNKLNKKEVKIETK